MKLFIICLSTLLYLVNGEPQAPEKFVGGIIGGILGNNRQCLNCQYDYNQATYCCNQNIDSRCCRYVNGIGGEGQFNGGSGGSYPGGGKPGNCPFNAGQNNPRFRREEAPGSVGTRSYTGGLGNNGFSNGFGSGGFNGGFGSGGYNDGYNGGYNGGFNGGFNGGSSGGLSVGGRPPYQRDECYSDYDCTGNFKCCQNYGYKQCASPLYSG